MKPQPGPGVPSDAFGTLKVMKREIGFAADRDRAERRAARVLVALAEALHLDQPAPRERRRDREVAQRDAPPRSRSSPRRARARRRRRAARRAGCRTSASGRASCSRKITSAPASKTWNALDVEGARRGSRRRSDTRSCPGRCRRRSGRRRRGAACRARSRRGSCAARARSPPLGLTATTLRTFVPPVTGTSTLNEPSPAAVVETTRRRRVRVGVRRGDVDGVARSGRAGDGDRRGGDATALSAGLVTVSGVVPCVCAT